MENIFEEHIDNELLRNIEMEYYKKSNEGSVSHRKRFEYAWCLIQSKYKTDVKKGIDLLEELCVSGDSEAMRDYLFFLAVANTKLGEYVRANDCIKKFLQVEPENRQANELHNIIKQKMAQGIKRAAYAGGAVLILGGLLGVGLSLIKK